jgi:ParB family chromosome partitioning protein
MLADAYEKGELRGKKLSMVRKILDQRLRKSKALGRVAPPGEGGKRKKLSPIELRLIYEREAEKQRQLSMNARLTHDRLIFATQAMKELISDKDFKALLVAEGLDKMPKLLSDRIDASTKR